MANSTVKRYLYVALACVGALSLPSACGGGRRSARAANAARVPDPERGRALASSRGCAACHEIDGVPESVGSLGPPLSHFNERTYIAGVLLNTPEYLRLWIRNPQAVKPGNAMPNLVMPDSDADDIAAFLLRGR